MRFDDRRSGSSRHGGRGYDDSHSGKHSSRRRYVEEESDDSLSFRGQRKVESTNRRRDSARQSRDTPRQNQERSNGRWAEPDTSYQPRDERYRSRERGNSRREDDYHERRDTDHYERRDRVHPVFGNDRDGNMKSPRARDNRDSAVKSPRGRDSRDTVGKSPRARDNRDAAGRSSRDHDGLYSHRDGRFRDSSQGRRRGKGRVPEEEGLRSYEEIYDEVFALHSLTPSDTNSSKTISSDGSPSYDSRSGEESDWEQQINAMCMNPLFSKKGNGTNMIRCDQAGPSETEVNLKMTLPLPHEFVDSLVPSKAGIRDAIKSMKCKGDNKCDLDYSRVDDQVLDFDEEMNMGAMPEFYRSLLEEHSEVSTEMDDVSHKGKMYEQQHRQSYPNKHARPMDVERRMEEHVFPEADHHVQRNSSLPSQIELKEPPSFLSSDDTFDGFDERSEPGSDCNVDQRKSNAGYFQGQRESPSSWKRYDSEKMPHGGFDNPGANSMKGWDNTDQSHPSFDGGERGPSPARHDDFGLYGNQHSSRSSKRRSGRNPDPRTQKDWVPATREQLDIVDQECPSFDQPKAMRSKPQNTRNNQVVYDARETNDTSAALGVPVYIAYDTEDVEQDGFQPMTSDVTFEDEDEEYAIVTNMDMPQNSSQERLEGAENPQQAMSRVSSKSDQPESEARSDLPCTDGFQGEHAINTPDASCTTRDSTKSPTRENGAISCGDNLSNPTKHSSTREQSAGEGDELMGVISVSHVEGDKNTFDRVVEESGKASCSASLDHQHHHEVEQQSSDRDLSETLTSPKESGTLTPDGEEGKQVISESVDTVESEQTGTKSNDSTHSNDTPGVAEDPDVPGEDVSAVETESAGNPVDAAASPEDGVVELCESASSEVFDDPMQEMEENGLVVADEDEVPNVPPTEHEAMEDEHTTSDDDDTSEDDDESVGSSSTEESETEEVTELEVGGKNMEGLISRYTVETFARYCKNLTEWDEEGESDEEESATEEEDECTTQPEDATEEDPDDHNAEIDVHSQQVEVRYISGQASAANTLETPLTAAQTSSTMDTPMAASPRPGGNNFNRSDGSYSDFYENGQQQVMTKQTYNRFEDLYRPDESDNVSVFLPPKFVEKKRGIVRQQRLPHVVITEACAHIYAYLVFFVTAWIAYITGAHSKQRTPKLRAQVSCQPKVQNAAPASGMQPTRSHFMQGDSEGFRQAGGMFSRAGTMFQYVSPHDNGEDRQPSLWSVSQPRDSGMSWNLSKKRSKGRPGSSYPDDRSTAAELEWEEQGSNWA